MISTIDSDPTIKIVAALQGNGSGIIVGKNSGISKVADLDGKKIAVPSVGSIQDIMLRQLFTTNNIDYSKQNITAMGAGTMPASISCRVSRCRIHVGAIRDPVRDAEPG